MGCGGFHTHLLSWLSSVTTGGSHISVTTDNRPEKRLQVMMRLFSLDVI